MVVMTTYTAWCALCCVPAALPTLGALNGGPTNGIDAVVWLRLRNISLHPSSPRDRRAANAAPRRDYARLALGGFLLLSLHAATFQLFEDLDLGVNGHGDGMHVALLILLLVLHGVARRTSLADIPAMCNVESLWESLTFRWMWPTVCQALVSDRLEDEDCADVYWADKPAKAYRHADAALKAERIVTSADAQWIDVTWIETTDGEVLRVVGVINKSPEDLQMLVLCTQEESAKRNEWTWIKQGETKTINTTSLWESVMLYSTEKGQHAAVYPAAPEKMYVPKSWVVTPVADKVKDETANIFENRSAKPNMLLVQSFS
ncbi:hypothetical protein AMAG_11206 [Allomyces macrogynus ATCC 38327]|uniref:Uncharacterized protein n=1 Tax=Allomyces macrogynus (strain ATCC 38327) TaxID=578462 RepID=A0A0L0SW13_ALLM3|nr:hypothetical protein AMAG_11206 [Allomyces macrogynus ATCC 38327]|eukprot:KNE66707.1 hypothetical protein AMAG_11206 [Allomyces macrogynus ATCC 38327]